MTPLVKVISLWMKKAESAEPAQTSASCSRKTRTNRSYARAAKPLLARNFSSDVSAELRDRVVLSEDILSVIFKHLAEANGVQQCQIARYAAVCRAWRQASRSLPMIGKLDSPLKEVQEALRTTEQQIGSLTLYGAAIHTATVLQDPTFRGRQAKSLHSLWTVGCGANGQSVDLNCFSELRKLFLQSDQAQPQVLVGFFDSRAVAKLSKLHTLVLRGYELLDLRFLPLSLKFLQTGCGMLLKGRPEDGGEESESFGPRRALQNSNTDGKTCVGATAFPAGLALRQVVMSCGPAAFLDEPLPNFFAVAEQVALFGNVLLTRDGPHHSYEAVMSQLGKSNVQQLTLDFDSIRHCRMWHGLQARRTALQLVQALRTACGGSNTAFHFSILPGKLYEQSVCVTKQAHAHIAGS